MPPSPTLCRHSDWPHGPSQFDSVQDRTKRKFFTRAIVQHRQAKRKLSKYFALKKKLIVIQIIAENVQEVGTVRS